MIDRIQVQDLYQEISVDHNLHVIDVRDQNEFALGHIPGALNNPHLRLRAAPNFVPDNHPVVLYDEDDSGGQSEIEETARLLQEQNVNVRILAGGLAAWLQADLPIEKELQ
jgi:rhodanese-related sulfurtransferase